MFFTHEGQVESKIGSGLANGFAKAIRVQWSYGRDGYRERVRARVEDLEEVCRLHNVARLSLFGSVLGKGFEPDNDLDVLVKFEPGRSTLGFGFVGFQGN